MSLPSITLAGSLSCSALGFGTMGLGGKFERDATNDAEAIRILHRALDLGITLFDTAEVYGAGHSEEILGAALKGRRANVVIATKFNAANSGTDSMIAACEASLRRLGTDTIDLYQTHWPNPAIPVEETAAGFVHLVTSGKARAIGFSNATTALMRKLTALLPAGFPVATSQQEYNLAERFVERSILPYCRDQGMQLLAYSPLGQGKLAQSPVLATLATTYQTTPAALALQWLRRQPNTIPIPMTSKIDNLEKNIAAFTHALPDAALVALDQHFARTVMEIPVQAIHVVGTLSGKAYTTLADARANTLSLSPSPTELARELADGDMLKPVKVRPKAGQAGTYDLYEGQLRYWAWRIAHDDRLPIVAQVTEA